MHLAPFSPNFKPLNGLFISAILFSAAAFSGQLYSQSSSVEHTLPKLNLAKDLTLSGLSSGAYMAGQYHHAFAEDIAGVAMLAGGPVYCAQNNLQQALSHCMANPQSNPDLAAIERTLSELRLQGLLAPLEAVAKSRVWIFGGSIDQTVSPLVTAALASQYANWLAPTQLHVVTDQPFAHHFPTDQPDLTACDKSETPYIASCNYDAAGKLLSHLLGKSVSRAAHVSGQLYKLNQHVLAPASQGQLAEFGYVYIPAVCEQGALCQLHVSFHGCRQDASQIGEVYATRTGLNAYADSNQLVVLYPQIEKSVMNPLGCWDWWGYSGVNYLSKEGPQLKAVKQLVDALR